MSRMRKDESWQGRRWLNEPKKEIEAQANVESDKADLQMWKVRRCRWSKLQHMHLISITESHLISVSTKNSTDSNSGPDRNVNNVTPTSFIPWHFLIASHTRVNAMHSRATIMRRACTKILLAHICLPTQIPKSQYYSSFWCSTSISRKAVESLIWKSSFFPQFFTFDVHFVRKGRHQHWHLKITILLQFLTFDVHFLRNGCDRHLRITILLQFLTLDVRFVRKGCVSWRSSGTAPALREKEKRARGRHTVRERRDLQTGTDVDLQMCDDVDLQMCQDVDLQMCQDVHLQMCQNVDLQMCQDVDLQMCQDVDLQTGTDV